MAERGKFQFLFMPDFPTLKPNTGTDAQQLNIEPMMTLAAVARGTERIGFSFDMGAFYGCYGERKNEQGKAYYEAMNVMRDDRDGRRRAAAKNLSFFGAPQVALMFMPSFGDDVRTAGDIGMYGQTFLLSLAARGLGGIPQTSLGFYAGTIREFLGISPHLKMLFGMSFGYPDDDAPGNRMRMGRVPVSESVHFHD